MRFLLVLVLFWVSIRAGAQNLILNPDCELPLVNGKIPNWVEAVGKQWTQGLARDQKPQQGQYFFFAGVEPRAELTQTILLDDYTCMIDRGSQTFQFTGYVISFPQTPSDQSQIIIEMLGSNDAVLQTDDLGTYSGVQQWSAVARLLKAPPRPERLRSGSSASAETAVIMMAISIICR